MTLSTPILWVALPLIIAAVTLIFPNRMLFGIILTSASALGLALLAAFFPEDPTFLLGSLVITVEESLAILGTALLTAALGVEPFLYAAVLIHIAVLASIPILSPEGKKPRTGILRYLILQTLALPLILLAGWLLSGIEALPSDSPLEHCRPTAH